MLSPSHRLNDLEEYYFSKKLPQLESLNESGFRTLNFGIGNPDIAPSHRVIRSLNVAARSRYYHGYQPYNGSAELRKAFCQWYEEKFNVKLDFENQLLPLLGSKEGMLYTSLAYLDHGDKALIPNLGYPTYRSATKLAGGVPVYYRLNPNRNWQPDWQQLENIDLTGVKILWLNYPNMPTGRPADESTFEKAVAFGKKNNILICNDNPYSMILNNDYKSILSVEGALDTAIEFNSLSKSHNMPGWRVGMVAGRAQTIRHILKVKSNNDSGMFLPVQMAAITALNSENAWYQRQNRIYKKRRQLVGDLLNILGCDHGMEQQQGMFIWAKVPPEYATGEEFSDWLLRHLGIFVTPGFIFGKPGKNYIRVSLCLDELQIKDAIFRARRHKQKSLRITNTWNLYARYENH